MESLEKITKETAIEKIEYIKSLVFDEESAHIVEDTLYLDFIKCIANNMYNIEEAIEIANVIKTVEDIEFERWYS